MEFLEKKDTNIQYLEIEDHRIPFKFTHRILLGAFDIDQNTDKKVTGMVDKLYKLFSDASMKGAEMDSGYEEKGMTEEQIEKMVDLYPETFESLNEMFESSEVAKQTGFLENNMKLNV